MLGASPDDLRRVLWRDPQAALKELGVPEDRIEWRANLVANADDVACLGNVGRFRGFPFVAVSERRAQLHRAEAAGVRTEYR